MFRFRFSLLHFLIVITLLAIGLAALASQSRLAASGVYSLYLALICLALAGAIAGRGDWRPFWIGFAVFGWTYFLFAFETTSSSSSQQGWTTSWLSAVSYRYYGTDASLGSRLITSELIDYLEDHLIASHEVGSKVMAQWNGGSYYSGTIKSADETGYLIAWDDGSTPTPVPLTAIRGYTPYARVSGHSLFGSLAALLGGILTAGFFGGKQERPEKPV